MPASRVKRHLGLTVLLLVLVASALGVLQFTRAGGDPIGTLRTWFWKADFWAFKVEGDAERVAALHKNATRDSREMCIACHDNKSASRLVLHRIHLRSDLLRNLQCHDCHQKIDLTKRGNTAVVTWVDVGFCKKCHSAFPGYEAGSPMHPEYFERDCTTCHKGDKAPKHDQPYLPKTTASSECTGCHGARVLPSTVGHERRDWLTVHGEEALLVGADTCYRCHDFGLKFCDTCHAKKPPTHLPAERWRTIHSREARADTRVCYSCHKVSYCKRCHLNHEEGWMARHPDFVTDEGDESCAECHSESSCGYCHMNMTDSAVSTSTP